MPNDNIEKLKEGEKWALLDCDDVLLDWIGGFGEFLKAAKGLAIEGRPDSWDMSKWSGVSSEKTVGFINEFNTGDVGFEKLKPMTGAVESIRNLKEFGFNIAIITSSSVSPSSVERRARNINMVFGDMIDKLHIVALGTSKEDILKGYENAIWVEDNVKNARLGASLGHKSFLIKAGHNLNAHEDPENADVTCVDDWHHLMPEIIRLVPDAQSALGIREASIRALHRASEAADYGPWTPRNPESETMNKLVRAGVVNLTKHANKRPSAELTDIGFAALGIDPRDQEHDNDVDFEI